MADQSTGRPGSGGLDGDHGIPNNISSQEITGELDNTHLAHELSPTTMFDASSNLGGLDLEYPALARASTADLPWPEEALHSFCYSSGGDSSGFESLDPRLSWRSDAYRSPRINDQMLCFPQAGTENKFSCSGANTFVTTAQTYSTVSDEAMDLDSPSGSVKNTPYFLGRNPKARIGQSRGEARDVAQSFANLNTARANTFTVSEDIPKEHAGTGFEDESFPVNRNQHEHMEDLSQLAMDLYAHLAAYDSNDNDKPTSVANGTAFQDQLVGTVLKTSNAFLSLLPFAASQAPHPSAPPPKAGNTASASSIIGVSLTTSTLDDDEDGTNISMDQTPGRELGGNTDPASPTHPRVDLTTVFQLLTCYMRIVRLHSIMHARILNYILAFPTRPSSSNSDTANTNTTNVVDSVPPVFPGMCIGGMSLDKFGTFQIKLLLQISMHLLGEIELVLGLPEEYRVSERKGLVGRGVLETSVSAGFVKSLMREEAWKGGRVDSARKRLDDLGRVLKGAIDL